MTEWANGIPQGIPKDYRTLVEIAVEAGFRLGRPGQGHWQLYPPDGRTRPIPIPTTPGNQNLRAGVLAQLRRAGLQYRPGVTEKKNETDGT